MDWQSVAVWWISLNGRLFALKGGMVECLERGYKREGGKEGRKNEARGGVELRRVQVFSEKRLEHVC